MARPDPLVTAVAFGGLGLAAFAVLRPNRTPAAAAAETAAIQADNAAVRHVLSPAPAAAGPAPAQGASTAAQASKSPNYSTRYSREVGTPIDFAAGAEVVVLGGVARFVRYDSGTRSAIWSVRHPTAEPIPWDTPPDMYDWRAAKPSPADAKRGRPVVQLFAEGQFWEDLLPIGGLVSAVRSLFTPKSAPPTAGGGGSW